MLEKIGRYQISEFIGEGGAGKVFQAWDPAVERKVAIKLLTANSPEQKARFKREARLLAQIAHPHVVTIYDFGEHDDIPYIVMRYMDGGSLRDRLTKSNLTYGEIIRDLSKLANGLDAAHALGVVHRDIKPENILYDQKGEPFLADFGLSRIFSDSNQQNLTIDKIMGTPAYMSPEQVRGKKLNHLSDIYSLAVILFELCNGYSPFQAEEPVAIAYKQVYEDVPEMTHLPKPVSDVIAKGLVKEPDDRYPDATSMIDAFTQAISGLSDNLPAEETRILIQNEPKPQKNRLWTTLAGIGFSSVLVGGLGLWLLNPFASQATILTSTLTPATPATKVSVSTTASESLNPTSATVPPALPTTLDGGTEIIESTIEPTSTLVSVPPSQKIEDATDTAAITVDPLLPALTIAISQATLYSGPNALRFEPLLTLNMAERLSLVAISRDREWVLGEHATGTLGWLRIEDVMLNGIEVDAIPLAVTEPVPEMPSATPTETSTPSPSPTVTATSSPTHTPTATTRPATSTPVPPSPTPPLDPRDPDGDGVLHDPSQGLYDLCEDVLGFDHTCGCPVENVPPKCGGGGGATNPTPVP